MLRNSWLDSVSARTATTSARLRKHPAFSPIQLELLETRTAPAGLTFTGGAGLIGLPGVDPPQISSGTLNGGAVAAAFAGPQHSRVVNLQVVFDQGVNLDPGAMVMSLHQDNVQYVGVAQPAGMGAVPALTFTPSASNTIWTVTFAGPNTQVGSMDGFASLVDGVYDFTVDGSKVHPVVNSSVSMLGKSTTTFARLFGDTGDPSSAPNGDATNFAAVVSSGDNFQFRNTFNNDANYVAYLDFDGNGSINTGDNLAFRGRFNKSLTWTVADTATVAAQAVNEGIGNAAAPSVPQVTSITPNFGDPSSAGQNSRISNIVVTFDQPVVLDDGAFILSLHTNNVRYGGVLQPSGMGAIPTINVIRSDDFKNWLVVFSGPNTDGTGNSASLKDGVYDFTIDASKVHSGANLTVNMASNQSLTFHRLFGDTTPPVKTAGSADVTAVVNSGDNLAFRGAFNNAAGYKSYLDFNGDGTINSADNLAFRTRFNKSLAWTA